MTIHKEGYPSILITTGFIILLNYLVVKYFSHNEIIIWGSYVLSTFLFVTVVQFFRAPSRKIIVNDDVILSPADGKIVVIEEVMDKEYFNEKRIQVSIFMSPRNVHINWSPISGLVKYVKYHPGFHYVAWHPKASMENEMASVVIASTKHNQEIMVKQIAGFLARRIKYYFKENQSVTQGQQLGFIKFGSRVDLLLPLGTDILVELDEKVKGNRTIIASLKK